MSRKVDHPNRRRAFGRMYGERHAGKRAVTININGVIGRDQKRNRSGVTALEIEARLAAHGKVDEITLRIDSEGGSIGEARKIHDVLRASGAWINALVTGMCASAAVTVLLAADWREAASGALVMIHQPEIDSSSLPATRNGKRWTAERHRLIARRLERTTAEKLELYAKRTSSSLAVLQREINNPDDKSMPLSRAISLGFIHALEGEAIWRGGRPYVFPR